MDTKDIEKKRIEVEELVQKIEAVVSYSEGLILQIRLKIHEIEKIK